MRERRPMESLEGKMTEPLNSGSVSTKLQRIAKMARENRQRVFKSLHHVIDLEWLHEAYRRTRKSGAVGIDGQTAAEYGANLESNLQSLLDRFKSGRYQAPPVRRVHIPKGDGTKTRPIGIPTLEDKVLQRAVAMVLGAIYEEDFLDCSFGFRPKRSAHGLLYHLRHRLMAMKGAWILDVDVQGFFDNLDHAKLREILDHRVRDGVLRRTIHKWLHAGVLEEGELSYSDSGTPQGGVISPLLANIYLHEVLDTWFESMVKPVLKGKAFLLRFADDFVLAFTSERDAGRVFRTLPKRFAKYGLTIHPTKTRLVRFLRPLYKSPGKGTDELGGRPDTFDFLGFTHYWTRSKKKNWVIKRKTARDRLTRALKRMATWCRQNRHRKVARQHAVLCKKIDGHYRYYGITSNMDALGTFLWTVERMWRKWLSRRSQRHRLPWPRFKALLRVYPLPAPYCANYI